jgi:hypothetical protein
MIKKIKKLLGICNHDWVIFKYGQITHLCNDEYSALQFVVNIICDNCGEHKALKSQIFDKSSIVDDYNHLEKEYYWDTGDLCSKALLKEVNAEIVWASFTIKCKNKYGINIKKRNF